jgi:hypothetical protein
VALPAKTNKKSILLQNKNMRVPLFGSDQLLAMLIAPTTGWRSQKIKDIKDKPSEISSPYTRAVKVINFAPLGN